MNKFQKASYWMQKFESMPEDFTAYLRTIYGDDLSLINRKQEKYLAVLKSFIDKYGDKDVVISRAPGRINLMGRHIEHRGGNINTIAIHKETIMVAAIRDDDKVCISNTNDRFGDFAFSISEERKRSDADEWLDYIESREVKETVAEHKGHWVNYVKGSVLRLLFEYKSNFKGMDIMCLGTVPIAGGVSSSSSIVVATAELVQEINHLDIDIPHFINLCGQSEWYVGSRGGSGDHAAIKCGVLNAFSPIEFEPIKVLDAIKIPEEYSVIVANSFIEAKKSEGAKDRFNQMVAAYEFGVMLIKKNYPEHKEKIVHLRDINPKTLNVSEKEIYEMLLTLPLYIKPEELYSQIPEEYHSKIRRITQSHKAPDVYNLRSAVLYGIAECERSRKCASLLKDGKINEFAEIMNISHNGDRVSYLSADKVFDYDCYITDEKLKDIISNCDKNAPDTELYKQPGGYACSVTEIDILVDNVLKQKGVLSAQISGAGLGGCIMIFCKKDYSENILSFLQKTYYEPNNFPNGAIIVKPIKGSMCL